MNARGFLRTLVVLVALGCVLVVAWSASADERCEAVRGTLTTRLVLGPQGPFWTGQMYLRLGESASVIQGEAYTLPGPPPQSNPAGVSHSEETLVVIVPALGSFMVESRYTANPASAPYVMNLHETGSLDPSAGTGAFANATGTFTIQGVFVTAGAFPPADDRPWVCIAEVTGVICNP